MNLLNTLTHKMAANALLLMASGCVALLALRILWTGELTLYFLAWNLFLAWLPWQLSKFLGSQTRTSGWHRVGWAVWLIFWPNAPYLITDLVHLRHHDGLHPWFDVPLLFAFAWTSLLLAFESLRFAEQSWSQRLPVGWGQVLVAIVCFSGALGVYIGRYLRWNSWDLLYRPVVVLESTVEQLTNHLSMPGFIAGYGAFLWIAYLYWRTRSLFPLNFEKQSAFK